MSKNDSATSRPLAEGFFNHSAPDGPITLVISRCKDCGAESFPARTARCAACSSPDLVEAESKMDGTLYSWTVTPRGGVPDREKPLIVGLVNLHSGLSVQGIIVADQAELSIDAEVSGCLVEHGPDEDDVPLVGYGFRLTNKGDQP